MNKHVGARFIAPNKGRRSIKMPEHDYSLPGWYYVTVCTHRRRHVFGSVVNGKTYLSQSGMIASHIWHLVPDQFVDVNVDAFVVMPNHVHGIIHIDYHIDDYRPVNNCRGAINRAPTGGVTGSYNPMGKHSLGEIVRWYKGRVTHEIRKTIDPSFAWQRSYYDHVIRNDDDLEHALWYIRTNPEYWEKDEYFS